MWYGVIRNRQGKPPNLLNDPRLRHARRFSQLAMPYAICFYGLFTPRPPYNTSSLGSLFIAAEGEPAI